MKFQFPDPLVLVFGLLVFVALLSALIPAGTYARKPVPNSSKQAVIVGSYVPLAQLEDEVRALQAAGGGKDHAPERLYDLTPSAAKLPEGASYPERVPPQGFIRRLVGPLMAVPIGLQSGGTADIVFLVFIVGGVVGILRATGAIDAMLGTTIRNLGGNPVLFVAGMMTLFVAGSSSIGMAEEYMPFVPILTAMCLVLKLDAIVALGMLYIGSGIGYGCAILNPFTVIPARSIAGISEPDEAVWVRLVLTVLMIAVGTHHLIRYARMVQKDPLKSLVRDVDYSKGFEAPKDTQMTAPRAIILFLAALALGIFAYGVKAFDFYIQELSAFFIGLGILAALVARMPASQFAKVFAKGAEEMTTTALLIGVARGIEVLLDETMIKDTVVHGIASLMPNEPGSSWIAGLSMLVLQSLINFFIPSGSGQAFVTMPIMAPLAQVTGVGRETAVLAYQMGDGLTNMIVPTNPVLMGMLALARIPYGQWLRFILPFLLKIYIICAAAIVIASMNAWGG